ncbi:hypothetical protein QZH41_009766 [Actinostola sp. cb2023]|nr:hypothetical protein QZH41_009766 [Actinostola sp. cb2023]
MPLLLRVCLFSLLKPRRTWLTAILPKRYLVARINKETTQVRMDAVQPSCQSKVTEPAIQLASVITSSILIAVVLFLSLLVYIEWKRNHKPYFCTQHSFSRKMTVNNNSVLFSSATNSS